MRGSIVVTSWFLLLLTAAVADAQPKSLFIGIDGMGFGEAGFSVAATPAMDSLINGTWMPGYQGAYSDEAFAGGVVGTPTEQPTVSGPGWSTMLTGVWTDRHGVTGNGDTFASGDYANNPPYLGTLKEALPALTTASYVYWPPIDDYIISSLDVDAEPTNNVDFHAAYMNDNTVANQAAAGIADVNGLDPDAAFVSFDLVDGAGHSCGSSGECYQAAIQTADGYVSQLLAAVTNRPNFANEDWQIVVTADHGHRPAGHHGGQSDLERTIPFIVASQAAGQGSFPTIAQEVSLADVAPTVLDHFGIARPDHYWGISRAAGAVSISADINGDGSISGDGSGTFADDDVVAFVSLWLQPNTILDPNPADLNLDGVADIADWASLNSSLPAMGAAILTALRGPIVPEPGTLGMIATGLMLVACRPRNAHRRSR